MIELKEITYVRLGTADIELAEKFATTCLGLEVSDRSRKSLYLRSDERAHTLYYSEGNPEEQTVGFEVENEEQLQAAAATLEAMGHAVHAGTPEECASRMVRAFIGFKDPTGNSIELVVRPDLSGRRYFPTRDVGITGFSHIGLNTTNPVRDEKFWTQVCNARVSDRIGDLALLRVNAIHHTLALAPANSTGYPARQPSGGNQRRRPEILLFPQRKERADHLRAGPASHFRRALPLFHGPGRYDVRVFGRRRRDRG